MTFTPRDETELLGQPSGAVVFIARRLEGQRLELCLASECVTLDRHFAPDRYNLD